MNRITLLLGIYLIGILLTGCAPKGAPVEEPVVPGDLTRETQAVAKEPWEVEWEKLLAASRKEGALNLYSSTAGDRVLRERAGMFKEKFGFELRLTSGSSSENHAKIFQEQRAGLHIADMYLSGPSSSFELKREGMLVPIKPALALPEVVNQELWYGGKLEWMDIEEQYVPLFANYPSHTIFINAELVKPGEIQSYYDLLNPKWKGKIVAYDPTTSGSGQTAFMGLLYNKAVDLDFFRQLIANGLALTRNKELQMAWLARGKYSIAWGASTSRLSKYIEAGAPVRPVEVIKEGNMGGSGGSAMGIMKDAPHPNAAKIFVNWYLSREGQDLVQRSLFKHSARIDIPPEGIPSYLQRKPGAKYFAKPTESEEWMSRHYDEYAELARQIFGPLKFEGK